MGYYQKFFFDTRASVALLFLILIFGPEMLRPYGWEMWIAITTVFHYMIPPVYIAGMRDHSQAKLHHPFTYYWEIAMIPLLIVFVVSSVGLRIFGVI